MWHEGVMLVVDPWHWLTEDGRFPDGPPRLRRNILQIARLIECGGPLRPLDGRETLVECGKRKNRKACPGFLWVVKTQENSIHAFCALCKSDDALISNWETTMWAEGPMSPVDLRPEGDVARARPDDGQLH